MILYPPSPCESLPAFPRHLKRMRILQIIIQLDNVKRRRLVITFSFCVAEETFQNY